MSMADIIGAAAAQALNVRVCSRVDCPHHGQPQPISEFYRRKSACKTCCRRMGTAANARRRDRVRSSPFLVDREPGGYLQIEPWRTWILEQIENSGGLKHGGVQVVAWELGVAERSIARWLYESKHVLLDVADRALCHRGTPWVLRDLYPELYDFEDAA